MSDQITILGCGLSGMITALAFAKNKISTLIIEAKSSTDDNFFNDIRTTALNAHSKEFFENIDIWESISDKAGPINDIYVADNKATQMLHFASNSLDSLRLKQTQKRKMGYLIENVIFKRCLYELVRKNELISISEGVDYKSILNNKDNCEIILNDTTRIPSKLIIICDGKNSEAKKFFFSNEIEQDYKQKAITFIVHHERNHEGVAVEHFLPSGPFAILPLQDENKSSVVWTLSNDYARAIMALSMDELTYLVQENFGPFLGRIKIVSQVAEFPLRAHGVERYYNKNMVLIADSAHIIHPLAGQGLNQGIKDIQCLVTLIAENGINQSVFKKYQSLRKNDNENMLLLTGAINDIFSVKSDILHSVRQLGFIAIEKIPSLKRFLIEYAMGKRKGQI